MLPNHSSYFKNSLKSELKIKNSIFDLKESNFGASTELSDQNSSDTVNNPSFLIKVRGPI